MTGSDTENPTGVDWTDVARGLLMLNARRDQRITVLRERKEALARIAREGPRPFDEDDAILCRLAAWAIGVDLQTTDFAAAEPEVAAEYGL